jgi:hypothetical protein
MSMRNVSNSGQPSFRIGRTGAQTKFAFLLVPSYSGQITNAVEAYAVTCEVAVMNNRGIALATDSAVTLDEGNKVYHTADKLFSLSPAVPVAAQ